MSTQQVPPPSGATASTASGPAGLISVPSEIVRLPQELAARLLQGPRTVILTGTVTGQGADGALQIRSQFGEIAVRTGTSVPPDRQVSLQIPPQSGQADLTPTQLGRQPIPATLLLAKPAAAATAAPSAPALTTAPPAPTPTLDAPPVPTVAAKAPSPAVPGAASAAPIATPATAPTAAPARVALPAGGSAPQPTPATIQPAVQAGTPPPQAGMPLPIGMTDRAPPVLRNPTPMAGASQQPPGGSANRVPVETGGRPAPTAPPLGRLALATQILTQAGDRPASGAPAPQPTDTAPAGQGAQPVAQAAAPRTTAMPGTGAPSAQATDAPIRGANVAPTAPSNRAAPPVAGQVPGRDAIPIDSVRRVPALREAVSVLSAADPTLATQFVRSVLPQANTQLAATLLFFLSAARGGDIRGWIGDRVATRLDEAGRADLLPKLSAELSAPARAAPDSPAGEWRSQTIPLYQDGDVGGLSAHVRRTSDDGGTSAEGDSAGRRFLLDIDLSRMGPLQLDGLVRDKRFDLTIRSEAAFPEPMRHDLRTLFRDASDAVGLHGGLTFQAGGHDWVTVAVARGGS